MRYLDRCAPILFAGGLVLAQALGPALAEEDVTPPFLPFSYPPDGSHMMGRRAQPNARGDGAGITTPLVPPPTAPQAAESPPRSRAQILDELFERLAAADDSDEAAGVAARIQGLWLQSGSDTADLLASRAAAEVAKGDTQVALQILDKVVTLDPDWAEGWNKRATLRYTEEDDFGAMEDLVHVLTLEPRHFGALSGMSLILQRRGMKKGALVMLRRATSIYPHNAGLQSLLDALVPEVEGRDL